MPFLEPQPHVSFGILGKRPVFLDLARDRYLALDPRLEASFRRLGDAATPLAGADTKALLDTGLFRPSATQGTLSAARAPPLTRSLLDAPLPRPRLLATAKALLLTTRMRRHLHAVPLQTMIERLRARRAGEHAVRDAERCAASAADFLAARVMVPSTRSCLPDALAMLDWLAPYGLFPTLVFGVKLHPFKAHCWVQAGTLLLTDPVDAVAEFTPVLVIE